MNDVMRRVAEIHNTTPEDVRTGIMALLDNMGLDMEPEAFVEICSTIVLEEIMEK